MNSSTEENLGQNPAEGITNDAIPAFGVDESFELHNIPSQLPTEIPIFPDNTTPAATLSPVFNQNPEVSIPQLTISNPRTLETSLDTPSFEEKPQAAPAISSLQERLSSLRSIEERAIPIPQVAAILTANPTFSLEARIGNLNLKSLGKIEFRPENVTQPPRFANEYTFKPFNINDVIKSKAEPTEGEQTSTPDEAQQDTIVTDLGGTSQQKLPIAKSKTKQKDEEDQDPIALTKIVTSKGAYVLNPHVFEQAVLAILFHARQDQKTEVK